MCRTQPPLHASSRSVTAPSAHQRAVHTKTYFSISNSPFLFFPVPQDGSNASHKNIYIPPLPLLLQILRNTSPSGDLLSSVFSITSTTPRNSSVRPQESRTRITLGRKRLCLLWARDRIGVRRRAPGGRFELGAVLGRGCRCRRRR